MASPDEPPPRCYHFSAALLDRQLCIYGGSLKYGESEPPTTLHVFSCDTEKWKVTETTRVNPPKGLWGGASTSSSLHEGEGYQRRSHRFQPEAEYKDIGYGEVLTNELHSFDLKEGECVGLPSQYLK